MLCPGISEAFSGVDSSLEPTNRHGSAGGRPLLARPPLLERLPGPQKLHRHDIHIIYTEKVQDAISPLTPPA